MLKKLSRWWKRRRLLRAQRLYQQWKACRDAKEAMLATGDSGYQSNPYNRHSLIRAAGKEAYYCELVEQLMREN